MALGDTIKTKSLKRQAVHAGTWSLASYQGAAFVDLSSLGVEVFGVAGEGAGPLSVAEVETAAGVDLQNVGAAPRLITLKAAPTVGASVRVALIDIFKPDRIADETRPAVLRYTGSVRALDLYVVPRSLPEHGEAGALVLPFVAYDPYWYATADVDVSMATTQTISGTMNERSAAGLWAGLPSPGGSVVACTYGPDGKLYVGLAAAPGVKMWDGVAWSTVGGGVNGRVNALTWFAGKLYVGGQFTQVGGSITVANIAAWSGSAWDTLSGGRSQVVNALNFAVYDGAIKLAVGLETSPYFAVYFPADLYWETSYVDPLDGAVKAVVPDARGGFYVAGAFNNCGSLAVDGVLQAIAEGGAVALGGGWKQFSGDVARAALILPDGRLLIGGTGNYKLKVWNGVAWSSIDLWSNGVYGLYQWGDHVLIAGDWYLQYWTGSAVFWCDLMEFAQVAAVAADGRIAAPVGGSHASAGVTTITLAGSAAVAPRITITSTASGSVYLVWNLTSGARLHFEQSDSASFLVAGEVAMIDIAAGTMQSNYRGSMLRALAPGSSFSAFALLPGTNTIAAYVEGATAQISYRPRYWSLDHADVP
jgi:hypothetical protein